MKVTVCFGSVRVLVPCGAGDLLVRDLVREATLRYKKATGQGPETWVGVRALRASSGGILDPDDRVRDVADDRETLTAECSGQAPQPRAAQADGASGSSAGTASPDMFRGGGGVGGSMRVPNTDSCVEVGEADLEDGANGLQVRRGSEPTLHQDTLPPQRSATEQTKRWSAAVVCREDSSRTQKVHPLPDGRPLDPDRLSAQHFQRQTNRLSMQFSGPGSGVWLDAAERIQTYGSKSLPRDARREPLGQDTPPTDHQSHRVEDMLRWVSGVNNVASVHPVQERPLDLLPEVGRSERAISGLEVPVSPSSKPASTGATQTITVTLVKGEKGLGFTITTRDNPTGGHCPIYIKTILPKGAAVTDGRLRAGDRLVSVNGVGVAGLTQQQVVSLLRATPTDSAVDLVVERPAARPQVSRMEGSVLRAGCAVTDGRLRAGDRLVSVNGVGVAGLTQQQVVSLLRATPTDSAVDLVVERPAARPQVSRMEGSVLRAGCAVTDGRLRAGDRLVSVNGVGVAGLTQQQVVSLLRATPTDSAVDLVVERPAARPQVSRMEGSVLRAGCAVTDGRLRAGDRLVSVNGVGVAGLTQQQVVSLLRATPTDSAVDLVVERPAARPQVSRMEGSVLRAGCAVTDGRLRAGDRLVSVNGVGVAGLTQQQVVSLLRATPTDSAVDLVVERPAARPQRVEPQQSPVKYSEKAIGTPVQETKAENGRVSTIVNALNQNSANSSIRGRIPKSSSKDDLLKEHGIGIENGVQETLNNSNNSVLGLRNKLILRLDVPVHDSEKAGLGISVKGKVTVGAAPHDLGIFIKSVLHGGAASRDGRLHTNDQLLSVNGVSLVGQSNAEAMETLRRALLHARPHVHGSISLTIARRSESMDSLARWKDDTPPNGNDTSNSNDNFNTVIYNNNDKDNNNTKESFDNHDGRGSKKHASIVTINNNNSWVSNQSDDSKGYLERDKEVPHDNKRDSFEWSRLDGWNPVIDRLTGLRNESYYMATGQDAPVTNGHHYRPNLHVHMSRSPPAHHNVIIEEDYGTTTRGSVSGGGGGESGSECGGGFSRDAVGRRSMSEKRHAAMDAKQTGTYKKIKEIKAGHNVPVGPSLGMRKSSSLESLQTAIQENQRHPRNEPIYARAHPPLKHWLTDDNGPEGIVRGSPQQSSLSHKKPSFIKSLSTMFRIGKPHKKPEAEVYGRSQPGRASEKSLSREALERHNREERIDENTPANQRLEAQHSRQSSSERRSERRAGAPPYRAPPARTAPTPHAMDSAWGPTGHYVNYDEIQQNLNARREKLSEVQIGQMRRQVHAQRAKAEEESRRVGGASGGYHSQRSCRENRPQSNYYEYDTGPPRRPGKLSHYH